MNDADDFPSCFDHFYQAYLPVVWAAALARTGNPALADDLAQETLLRAWRHFETLQLKDAAAQRAWLLRTLRHRAVEAWRGQPPPETFGEIEAGADDTPSPLRLDVLAALADLDATDREIVALRYFAGMSSREIGEALEMPDGTVRRRLSACRRTLATRLAHWSKP